MKKLSAVFFVLPVQEPAKRLHFFDTFNMYIRAGFPKYPAEPAREAERRCLDLRSHDDAATLRGG
jgi:hypothetical protein